MVHCSPLTTLFFCLFAAPFLLAQSAEDEEEATSSSSFLRLSDALLRQQQQHQHQQEEEMAYLPLLLADIVNKDSAVPEVFDFDSLEATLPNYCRLDDDFNCYK